MDEMEKGYFADKAMAEINRTPQLIQEAAQLAKETFEKNLDRLQDTYGSGLERRLEFDYDHNAPFSLEHTRQVLAQEQEALLTFAEFTPDAHALVKVLDHYVNEKIESLFFETNDLPTARLTRDLLEQFVIASRELLTAKGAMDEATGQDLDRLVKVYDIGLLSYIEMRAHLHQMSGGKVISLREWARREVRDEKRGEPRDEVPLADKIKTKETLPATAGVGEKTQALFAQLSKARAVGPKSVRVSPNEITVASRFLFNKVMAEQYGVTFDDGSQAHPCMFHFMREAERLAKRMISNQIAPGTSMPRDQIAAAVQAQYQSFQTTLEGIHQHNPTQQGMVMMNEFMESTRCEAYGLPADFETLLQKAATKAEAVAMARLPARHREWEHDQRLNWSDGRDYAEAHGLAFGKIERSQECVTRAMAECKKSLLQCNTKEYLVNMCDKMADHLARGVFYGADEPSQLLFMQDFMQAFTREVTAGFRAAEVPCLDLVEPLEKIGKKFDYAYRSYEVQRSWCLDTTGGRYDNVGIWAIMSQCTTAARHFTNLTPEEKKEIPLLALSFYKQVCQGYGVPPDLTENPFIPLLFDESFERARHEYESTHQRDHLIFSDKVDPDGKWNKAQSEQAMDAAQKIFDQIQPRAMQILDQAVATFPGGKQVMAKDQKSFNPRDPSIRADKLVACMEFFEQAPTRGRTH